MMIEQHSTKERADAVCFAVGSVMIAGSTLYLFGAPGCVLAVGVLFLLPLCWRNLRPQVHVYLDGKKRTEL